MIPLPQAIAAAALVTAAGYFGIKAYSSWSKAAIKTDPKKPGATIDISTVAGVQQGLIALGYSVGAKGADGKNGPDTGKGINAFRAAQTPPLPASTTIDNSLRTPLAVALRAKGYTVTGESGPPVATIEMGTDASGTKNSVKATTKTAQELYDLADKLEAEADALNDAADQLELDAADVAWGTAEDSMLAAAKAKRDLADKKMGEASGYRGAAKLNEAMAAAAAAATKGLGGANVGRMPPHMIAQSKRGMGRPVLDAYGASVRQCYDDGFAAGRRQRATGVPQGREAGSGPAEVSESDCSALWRKGAEAGYADQPLTAPLNNATLIPVKSTLPPYLRGRIAV